MYSTKAIINKRSARLIYQQARLFSQTLPSNVLRQLQQQQQQGVLFKKSDAFHLKTIQQKKCSKSCSCSPKNRFFSTNNVLQQNLETMDHSQLKDMALNYARKKDDPIEAEVVLERLKLKGCSIEVLSEVETSIIDAWIKYQRKKYMELEESLCSNNNGLSRSNKEQKQYLEKICYAAERASEILDSMKRPPSPHLFEKVLTAWADAATIAREAGLSKVDFVQGIPQRAKHLLDLQESPTTESYNQVLKAWAHSQEYLRGSMAELLFQKINDPNGETLKTIIRAWCWSKERRCAFTATGHFMRMMRLLETGRSDMEPSMEDFHILFEAWTRAEDKNAPSKVQTVLQIIENAHKKGLVTHGADENCYRDALVTMSRRVNVPEVGELVDTTLTEMKDAMLFPDTACYSAAILAWKNVATSRECDDREKASTRAMTLLQEMTKAYHRTTTVTVKPTTENFNHVLESLTVSNSSKAPHHAESLLKALEDASSFSDDKMSMGPNAESYKLVLAVLRNSKSANKLARALSIIRRFEIRMDSDDKEFGSDERIVEVFSTFIDVCAHSGTQQDPRKIMTLALRTADNMRSLGLHPNSSTYTSLLGACNNLIAVSHERQKILENIFSTACKDGYVNQILLEQFKQASSSYLFAKAVISKSREIEGMKVVPESWTRNTKGFMVNTKEGRQVLPLSIDGKFTFTRAAAEYKMRKLRRRQNQKMLQGGRVM